MEPDLDKWIKWRIKAEGFKVAHTFIGDCYISTVFLGLDHNWSKTGPPVLWETMVFGGELDQRQMRCTGAREQAEAMHAVMVKHVEAKQLKIKS